MGNTSAVLRTAALLGFIGLAGAPPASAQWDDNCRRQCLVNFVGCVGARDCSYQSCRAGETCVGGRCCDSSGRCRGSCGWTSGACITPCIVGHSVCTRGCFLVFVPPRWWGLDGPAFGPLRERLEAVEQAFGKGVETVERDVAGHFEGALAEVESLIQQQKIDPARGVALKASLTETRNALLQGALRRCAEGLGELAFTEGAGTPPPPAYPNRTPPE